MLNWDIQVNINIAARTEKEAEEAVAKILNRELEKPALQRKMNGWEFVEWPIDDKEVLITSPFY